MRAPRTLLMALLLAVLAIAAAGCGGSEVAADEVPGAPPALTVPTDEDLGGGGNADNASSDDGNASGDDNADADADTDTDGTTDDTATPEATAEPPATDDTTGGTTTPETTAPEDTATNDTPPAGSEAEQFESFCEQNAGAC